MLFKKHHLFLLIVALLLAASFAFPEQETATVLGQVMVDPAKFLRETKAMAEVHQRTTTETYPVRYTVDDENDMPSDILVGDTINIRMVQQNLSPVDNKTVKNLTLEKHENEIWIDKTPRGGFPITYIKHSSDTPECYQKIDIFSEPGTYKLSYRLERVYGELVVQQQIQNAAQSHLITVHAATAQNAQKYHANGEDGAY